MHTLYNCHNIQSWSCFLFNTTYYIFLLCCGSSVLVIQSADHLIECPFLYRVIGSEIKIIHVLSTVYTSILPYISNYGVCNVVYICLVWPGHLLYTIILIIKTYLQAYVSPIYIYNTEIYVNRKTIQRTQKKWPQ